MLEELKKAVYEICGCQGVIPVFFHLLYLLLLFTPYPVTHFAISRHRHSCRFFCNVESNSSMTIGLDKNPSIPLSSAFFLSSSKALAVMARMVIPASAGSVG